MISLLGLAFGINIWRTQGLEMCVRNGKQMRPSGGQTGSRWSRTDWEIATGICTCPLASGPNGSWGLEV